MRRFNKNDKYLSFITESKKSNYDTKIYNKYFKSYVEPYTHIQRK